MRAPEFWTQNDWRARAARAALMPLGWLYGAAVAIKAKRAKPFACGAPVICVGNISAGGTGKTPIAIAIAKALSAHGKNPFFLSRGHGGKLAGPIMVEAGHRARDVGDEPLLLAAAGPTVVSRNRAEGARLALAQGADAIVMDDGHQNFTLAKDVSLVVVDASQGFGNGLALPAGPLRESVRQGLARADAVILIGDGAVDLQGFKGPILHASIHAAAAPEFRNARVIGFAGIGRPEKFFRSLAEAGAEIVAERRFPDHHVYAAAEIARLKSLARSKQARLVTTEKDYVRLSEDERGGIDILPIEARFDDTAQLDRVLGGLG